MLFPPLPHFPSTLLSQLQQLLPTYPWAIDNREDFTITMPPSRPIPCRLITSQGPDPALLSFSVSAPSPRAEAIVLSSLNVTLYVGHQRLRQSFSSGLFDHLRHALLLRPCLYCDLLPLADGRRTTVLVCGKVDDSIPGPPPETFVTRVWSHGTLRTALVSVSSSEPTRRTMLHLPCLRPRLSDQHAPILCL